MPRCAANTEDGRPCERIVTASQRYCYSHDPARSEDRRRNASKGGRGKGNQRLAKLDKQLEDLATDTLEGGVDRGTAAVVNQIINSRLRAIEIERKLREAEELAREVEEIREALELRKGGRAWGA